MSRPIRDMPTKLHIKAGLLVAMIAILSPRSVSDLGQAAGELEGKIRHLPVSVAARLPI